jgi:hypothetical protein
VNLYVVGAAVIAGLGLASYGLYQRGEAISAKARVAEVTGQRDRAIQAVKDSEEANARLKALNKSLDDALVARDSRLKALDAAKRKLAKELDEIKQTLPLADQECLDRELPESLANRLRNP